MKTKLQLITLISGRGSNLKALLDNAQDFEIKGVISDNPQALGLNFARELKIYSKAFSRKNFPSLKALKTAILEEVKSHNPDLVALAGFMQILEKEFVEAFPGKIINIHPALLPKFPGLHTHQRALEAGEKTHGCSVHVVDAGVDTGPIIAQAEVQLLPNDSEELVAKRVLEREHAIYPWVLNAIARGEIQTSLEKITYSDLAREEAQKLGFKL